jgi:hypothetical protein
VSIFHYNFPTFTSSIQLKDSPYLDAIFLDDNQISALHPQTFAHLSGLTRLFLSGNHCVDKTYFWGLSLPAVEEKLWDCGRMYDVYEPEFLERTGYGKN